MKKLLIPFAEIGKKERIATGIGVAILLFVFWSASGKAYIPTPMEIIGAFPTLFQKYDMPKEFVHSLAFCFKCIAYSTVIALFIAYLSVLPLFTSFCTFLRKFRFLPSTGLSLLFLKINNGNVPEQMEDMLIFGVTTWLIDSMVRVALDVGRDDVMYARSLRLSPWQSWREILVFGKATDMFQAVISNFAIAWLLLASIENMSKGSGGIGVILSDSAKYFKYEQVYAIQFLILFTGISIDFLLHKMMYWIFPNTR